MIGYADKEMISSTELQKSLSTILNKLKNRKLTKVAILRNNKIESVIISKNEYEKLIKKLELLEHIETYNMIMERSESDENEYMAFEDVLKKAGINKDEL
jgi:PHD/YefM family antitoxin component YafN of YafNO toxin-antitoxin module